MITIEGSFEKNPYGIPVKLLPDMMKCYQCMDYHMEHEDDLDCEACKERQYRYGYLKEVEHKMLSTYGLVVFEDGEIASVPLRRLSAINVPKVER